MTPTSNEDQTADGGPATPAVDTPAATGGEPAGAQPAGDDAARPPIADAEAVSQASSDEATSDDAPSDDVSFDAPDEIEAPGEEESDEDDRDEAEIVFADDAFDDFDDGDYDPFASVGEPAEEDLADEDDDSPAAAPARTAEVHPGERVAKVLARAGLCSRRDAEAWVLAGRVAVNGKILDTPAHNVVASDLITVDGKPIPAKEQTRLWLYHKPRGLVTTNADPDGRPTIFERLPEELPRVMTIGRLDINTEGLLLLTNDGGLARVLELPATGWMRRYRVRAHGNITQADLDRLSDGLAVDGVLYGPIDAVLDRAQGDNVWITLSMREGKNREVKNVLGALGLNVNRLIRVSFGPFLLGELQPGEVREVRSRVLRDQIGGKLAEDASADFEPRHSAPERKGTAPRATARTGVTREPRPYPGGDDRQNRPTRRGDRDERPDRRRDRDDGRGFGERRSEGRDRPFERPARAGGRVLGVIDPNATPGEDGRDPNAPIIRREEPKPNFERSDDRRRDGGRSFGGKSSSRSGDRPRTRDERPRSFTPWANHADRGEGEGRGRGSDAPRGERAERPFRERRDGEGRRNDGYRGEGYRGEGRGERRSEGSRSERPSGERTYGDRGRPERSGGERPSRPYRDRAEGERSSERPRRERAEGDRPSRPFRERDGEGRGRPEQGERRFDRPRTDRPRGERPQGDRPARPFRERGDGERPARPFRERPEGEGRGERRFDKPRGDWPQGDRPARPFRERPEGGDRPRGDRPQGDRPHGDRPARPFRERPEGGDRPRGERPARPFRERPEGEGRGERRFDKPRGDRPQGDRSHGDRPQGDRPSRGFRERPEGGFKPGGAGRGPGRGGPGAGGPKGGPGRGGPSRGGPGRGGPGGGAPRRGPRPPKA